MLSAEDKIKRANIFLMKHKEVAWYSGFLMMGESRVDDNCSTAYTDGVNKVYGRNFIDGLTKEEVNGLVLHECMHIVLRHPIHGRRLFEEDAKTANQAADYVVNSIILNLKDTQNIRLPESRLYDPKYTNMTLVEVYNDLRKKQQQQEQEQQQDGSGGSQGEPSSGGSSSDGQQGKPLDEHDFSKPMTPEEMKQANEDADRALREGALLAGRLGLDLPRAITDLMQPAVDWRAVLRDFVMAQARGKDEMTWRQFNRRHLANDLLLPTSINETMGELVVAIDTSASISQQQINEFASELVSICDTVTPESLRVLWWDTMVHGEQQFTEYSNLQSALKPQGHGGTRVSCVSEYIAKQRISPEAVIVFTDGYLESEIKWQVSAPTLWLVTENKHFAPPTGTVVRM